MYYSGHVNNSYCGKLASHASFSLLCTSGGIGAVIII